MAAGVGMAFRGGVLYPMHGAWGAGDVFSWMLFRCRVVRGRSSRKFIPCARPYGSWESFRKIPKLFSILFFTGKCDVAFAISFRFMLLFFVMPTTITLE